MEGKHLYIAETNEREKISCVWVGKVGQRGARPFDPTSHQFNLHDPAEFFGAPAEAIERWLCARQGA